MPLTPIIAHVFPNPSECNYDAIPSISSLPTLPSPLPTRSTISSTRSQRKRKVPAVVTKKIKKSKQKNKLIFGWKKSRFEHAAEITDSVFNETIPCDCSAVDYFYRFFPEALIDDICNNTNLYSVQETGKSIKVTREELQDFLAINILMGIVVMPSYKDNWKTSLRYAKVAE